MSTKLCSFIFLLSTFVTACTATPAAPINPSTATPNIIIPTPPSCTNIITEPTPGPDTPSVFPPESKTDRVRGAENPSVIITDYSDYQDLRSGLFEEELIQLLKEHPNDVRVVSRVFPLIAINDKAALAAQAAEAAAEQNKFWEVHNLLFAQQENWVDLSVQDFEQWITAQASALEMNVDQFKFDLKREDIVAKIQKAWEDGQAMGLPGTPLVLINGQIYSGPRDYNSLNDILQLILLGKRQYASCPPVTVQPNRQHIATLHTEKGDVVIQLFADKAPITVNSFIFLARNGWYDNITFHRVIPDLFAQTGDPSGTGKGNPGYYVITEIDSSLNFTTAGMVAMVNSGPDTSGSQFFITYGATTQYDGQYTIFGQVLSGMEVVRALTPRDAQPGTETPPGDKLISITIEEK
ncbi:MAG: peptidylprolyl isomerase [Anaerolineae bacterium]|nr:peptidylprolyl isomerase [Anaerolineae bacterium]MCI0610340.1 peptidylprolyl isomerase [Anaerolineae bacterium]